MKKAQTEIIGLAIIVILLILGLTFVVKFIINKEPTEFRKEFTQSELATNMLNTFLETTSEDCSGFSMTELLQDCGQSGSIFCGPIKNKKSCDYVEQEAGIIFGSTLGEWNVGYEFKVFKKVGDDEVPLFNSLGPKCPGDKKSKTFPIPTTSGTLFAKLDICRIILQ